MTEFKGSAAAAGRAKPPNQGRDGGGKGKGVGLASPTPAPPGKKKSEDVGGRAQLPQAKLKPAAPAVTKSLEVKGKASGPSSTKAITKTMKKTTVRVKAEKKAYTLLGQKYDPPEEREPLRIFYESLSKQIPSSEMAEFWMMEHGLLSPEKAKKAYERKQKRQQQLRIGTPVKSSKPERPESSKKPQILRNGDIKIRKRVNYSDDDNDFIAKYKKNKS